MATITIIIQDELKERAKIAVIKRKTTISDMVREHIQAFVQEVEQQEMCQPARQKTGQAPQHC